MAEPIRLLHVEDDPEFGALAAEFLEAENERLDVTTETDPDAALERVETGDVDCVVSDYDMPETNGIELLERIRAVDPAVPFVLFTGKGSGEVASEALAKGATDYLQKESGGEQYAILANRVENAVVQHRSVAELERQSDVLETAQDIADFGVFEYDLRNEEAWISESLPRVVGDDPADPAVADGDSDLEGALSVYHPDDRSAVRDAFRRATDGETCDLEVRLDAEERRWVRIRCKPATEDGAVSRVRATVRDVTERKLREEELRRTERRFEAVFEDPQLLVGLLDTDGRLLDANDVAMEYVTTDLDAIRDDPFWETPWWSDEDRADVRRWVERAATGEYVTYEAEHRLQDGESHTVSGAIRPVTENGAVVSLIASARNVTPRAQNERERDFYEALVEETGDVITVVDDEGIVQYQNPAVEAVLGYDQEALVGDRALEYVHPDDRAAIAEWFDDIVSEPGATADPVEHRLRHADGSWRWVETTVRNRADPALDAQVVTIRDVTARKERERALEGYERIVAGIGVSLFATNADGEYTQVDTSTSHISGYDGEELVGGGAAQLYDEDDVAAFEEAVFDLVAGDEEVVTVEATMHAKDGTEIPVETTFTALFDADGDYDGTVGVVRDLTDQKEVERELREYESIIRALPDEMVILNTDGIITRLIPPTGSDVGTSGYEPADLEGEHVSTVMAETDVERGADLIEELVTTDRDRATYEIQIVDTDGERHWREDNVALLEGPDGETRGTVGVLRDIEERKAYEQELERQNERLEEFAEIASHDLRNPLNLAQGYLDLVAEDCDSEYTGKVADALTRMERLIDDTLTMARQGTTVSERTDVELERVVPECWAAVSAPHATVDVVDPVTISGDEGRIRQVFENLLRNAVEHGGDDVTVEIGAIDDEGIYVADDGPGIPPENREGVFDAGFTTASDGTGFGLAIVGEIVEAHGWEIAVTESASGGARFEITGVDVRP